VDYFVLLADAQGLLLGCADYYRPVLTPWEAALALGGAPWDEAAYRVDFDFLLAPPYSGGGAAAEAGGGGTVDSAGGRGGAGSAAVAARAGGGNIRDDDEEEDGGGGGGGAEPSATALALPTMAALQLAAARVEAGGRAVAARSGAEFLALKRTYRGLETPATGAAPKAPALAADGRAGRAAGYAAEGAQGGGGGGA
jgi:diphthamide biosynthesis protein 2